MSLLREVKPKNARTARIVKSREPQITESRKKVLLLHGTKCPEPLRLVLKTITSVTKPHAVVLTKKNENIVPFEDPASLEFLAMKNECAVVCFATSSKKRPNALHIARMFDNKTLDLVELLLITSENEPQGQSNGKDGALQIGVEMKPMIVFAGPQWDDQSTSDYAVAIRQLKSTFLDIFQGEEISSVDVAGLQYVLFIAAPEHGDVDFESKDPSKKPVVCLRWFKVRTTRSDTPKVPRVELDQVGPGFDFRVGRFKRADESVMKEAMKHGRKEARVKKNIETDAVGDKLGRIHLGKQDLGELQTRKMKGLKRGRDEVEVQDEDLLEDDVVSQSDEDEGGMVVESSEGESGDEIDIGESEEEADQLPKRQRVQ